MIKWKKLDRLIKRFLSYILIGWPIVGLLVGISHINGLLKFLFIVGIELFVIVIGFSSIIYGLALLERSKVIK